MSKGGLLGGLRSALGMHVEAFGCQRTFVSVVRRQVPLRLNNSCAVLGFEDATWLHPVDRGTELGGPR